MPPLALFVLLTTLTAVPGDDAVPAGVEALLAEKPPLTFGYPVALPAEVLGQGTLAGTVRAVTALDDITGDGAADLVTGTLPGGATLAAWDGRSGALLWRRGGPGGFRSPRALAFRDGKLLAGESSALGRVACRRSLDGSLCWSRDLATRPGVGLTNLHSVRWLDDVDGDGRPDVAVAAGAGVDQALTLSGADGSTLWSHAAGDVVYDLIPTEDRDGDGRLELLAVGGDTDAFARLLDGASGVPLWDVPLDGPGSVAMLLDDVDGDGVRDLAVGQWNAPGACLLCLSGADGARLWEAADVSHDVTSLAPLGDLQHTGLRDIAVGSFDNAINAVLAFNGVLEWRREGSQTAGAVSSMLDVVALGDLDQSGLPEVGCVSIDQHYYLMGGELGQYMAKHDLGARASVLCALPDADGDGRPEVALGGEGSVAILDGNAGLADGPWLELEPPASLADEGRITIWLYPTTSYFLFLSLGTGEFSLPAWKAPLLLDPATLFLASQGPAPGAGSVILLIPPLPASLAGVDLYLQAAQAFGPNDGWLGNLAGFTVPRQ